MTIRNSIFSIALFSIWLFSACSSDDNLVSLRSLDTGWTFTQAGKDHWLPATVPGCVHTDLLNAERIDDPFFRSNEDSLQWISKEDWIYRTTFSVTEQELSNQQVELVFEGLDTHASVKLNDSEILSADNMFRTWVVDVKDLLRAGENTLEIYFRSAEKFNLEQAAKLSYVLPEDERVHSRKAQYQFGWDWGPRFITSGIWRPVHLRMWNEARIDNVFLHTPHIDEKRANVSTQVSVVAHAATSARLIVSSPEKAFKRTVKDVQLQAGHNTLQLDFEIENPILWWAHGMGDAHLYKVDVEMKTAGGSDFVSTRIGVRTIELVQEDDEIGRSFEFHLNGVPVFAKGANIIPMESFPTRLIREDYEKIIDHALKANYNMLRVWGGGYYKDNLFYELCDENGIMVWQDFMFACAMYPGDEDFLHTVREEIKDNVRRLRNHASLALWCGNNEIYNGWFDWNWQTRFNYTAADSLEVWKNYQVLFDNLIPEVLQQEDPTRNYWPSSPLYGWGHEISTQVGDNHYWGVWWGKEPFEKYREKVSRFMSEFGFQSFPAWETVKSFSLEEDRHLWSGVMRTHQKHPIGNETIDEYMKRWYPEPKDFESFVYMSQVLQAEGMRVGISAHRQAMPYSMGTLYWQFNDCWPVASWSSVDYYGNWKALHYYARKAYCNLYLAPVSEHDRFMLYLVSDLQQSSEAMLNVSVYDFKGEVKNQMEIPVTIKTNSHLVVDLPVAEILNGAPRESSVLIATLSQKGEILAANHHYFELPKNLHLGKPAITFTTRRVATGYELSLETDVVARNVYLHFPQTAGWWTDNFFELIPGHTKKVVFETRETISNPEALLQVRSLADAFE